MGGQKTVVRLRCKVSTCRLGLPSEGKLGGDHDVNFFFIDFTLGWKTTIQIMVDPIWMIKTLR